MEFNNHNDNILNQVGRSTDFSDQTPNSSSGTTAPAETVSDENEDDAHGMMGMPMAICSMNIVHLRKLIDNGDIMTKRVGEVVENNCDRTMIL